MAKARSTRLTAADFTGARLSALPQSTKVTIRRQPRIASLGLLQSPTELEEWQKSYDDNEHILLVLCDHYGVPRQPGMYRELAVALASELYPEPKHKGRKPKWTPFICGVLVVEMGLLIVPKKRARGPSWASIQLASTEPWKSFVTKHGRGDSTPGPAEVLRAQYQRSKCTKWAELLMAFRKRLLRLDGNADVWRNLVAQWLRSSQGK